MVLGFKRKIILFIFLISSFFPLHSFHKNAIGNQLMQYYHALLNNSLNGTKVEKDRFLLKNSSSEILAFYQHLPDRVDFAENEIKILKSFPVEVWKIEWPWSSAEWGELASPYYLLYLEILGNICKKTIPSALEKAGYKKEVKYPVIHYRLGDVPFTRSYGHHLCKYSFFTWALNKVCLMHDNTVIVVASFSHNANEQRLIASEKYLSSLLNFLMKNDYKVVHNKNSIMDDFSLLVFAPALISGTSSFAFMAGLANKNVFISSLIGSEVNGKYLANSKCDWMCQEPPLLHSQVADYFDIEQVIQLLNQ